jgi:hypothetical protein
MNIEHKMRNSFISPAHPADTLPTVQGEIRVSCSVCDRVKLLDRADLIDKGPGAMYGRSI